MTRSYDHCSSQTMHRWIVDSLPSYITNIDEYESYLFWRTMKGLDTRTGLLPSIAMFENISVVWGMFEPSYYGTRLQNTLFKPTGAEQPKRTVQEAYFGSGYTYRIDPYPSEDFEFRYTNLQTHTYSVYQLRNTVQCCFNLEADTLGSSDQVELVVQYLKKKGQQYASPFIPVDTRANI